MKQILFLTVLFVALIGSFGQVFLKMGSEKFSFEIGKILTNFPFLIGVFLYGLSAILFVWCLKQGDLSILYPLVATSYIWVTLFSFFFFGETITLNKFIGIFLILFGVYFVSR
ncbi:MAG: EamA family transporter [Nanoarchaeota archaeon]|nr:EamA family transporter [Nanoarchaeota archaeon]